MAEVRLFMNEDAYYKVLKAFAAGAYDLKKELVLAKLRNELRITDQRHTTLRKMIEEGKDLADRALDSAKANARPSTAASARDRGSSAPVKRKRESVDANGFGDEDYAHPSTHLHPPISPFQQPANAGSRRPSGAGQPPKRPKKESHNAEERQKTLNLPAFTGDINELIGYKIERYWPENGGWFMGAITDYRPATGEHCIAYDMNTVQETYEWFNMSKANPREFQLLDEKINIIEFAPKAATPAAAPRAAIHTDFRPPTRPGSAGRGLSNGRGRGRGERIGGHNADARRGHSSQEFDQTAYQPISAKANGVANRQAFTVESEDEISSDESFSD